MKLEVRIERLGAQGDGVAQGPEGLLFVPYTLPGELVRVAARPGMDRAEPLATLESSPGRIAAVCRYFGTCGGCALQYMEAKACLAWKPEQIISALSSRGLDVPVEEIRPVPLGSRTRAAGGVKDCDGLHGNVRARPAPSRGWRLPRHPRSQAQRKKNRG